MAAKRIKKKTAKANVIHAIQIEQLKLQKIEVEAEMLDIKIKQAQLRLSSKQRTLESLQRQLNDIQFIIANAEKQAKVLRPDLTIGELGRLKEESAGLETEYSNAEQYVAIKRFHELVDRGIIREDSIFNKYDAPAFLNRALSFEEIQKLTEEGEREALRLVEKSAKRMRDAMSRMPRF